MRNSLAFRAFSSLGRRLRVGAGRALHMSMMSLARRRTAAPARPDWLPHPLVLNLILALWTVAAALQLLGGSHL